MVDIDEVIEANKEVDKVKVCISFDLRRDLQRDIYGRCSAFCSNCKMPLLPMNLRAVLGEKPKFEGYQVCRFRDGCENADVIYEGESVKNDP